MSQLRVLTKRQKGERTPARLHRETCERRAFGNVFFSYKRQLQVLPQKFIELREKYNNNKNNN